MINTILLAEDSLEYCFFFKKALNEIAPSVQFTNVHDGDQLMMLLESFLPDLLFLDLSMPCKNGMQCIQQIRQDSSYDALPIVVFTISKQNANIQTAYECGANLYFVKPQEYYELVSSLQTILSLDWSNPKAITNQHYRSNKYVPFKSVS